MSLAPLLGLPGKIKTLLDRVPSDTPTQLDKLDVNVSTRASSSEITALDTVVDRIEADTQEIQADVNTLVSRVTGVLPVTRTSNACNVTATADGTDHLEVSLGTTFNVLRTHVQG